MRMDFQKIFVFLLLILIPLALNAEGKIKIGVSLPLSSNAANYGNDIKNSLEFANSELANNSYEFIFEDDKCEPREGVSIANKFINIDKVKYVLGFGCSGVLLSTALIYERAKIIAFTPLASAADISSAGDYIFRTWPSDGEIVRLLAKHIFTKNSKVGIVSEQTGYAQGLKDGFIELAKSYSTSVVQENYLSTDSDFRSLFLKLQQANVTSIFLNSQSDQTFLVLIKQLRQMNIDLPVFAAYWPGSSSVLEKGSDLVEGVVYADSVTAKEVLNHEGVLVFDKYI